MVEESEGENMVQEMARINVDQLFTIIGRQQVEIEALREHVRLLQTELQQREHLLRTVGAQPGEEPQVPTGP